MSNHSNDLLLEAISAYLENIGVSMEIVNVNRIDWEAAYRAEYRYLPNPNCFLCKGDGKVFGKECSCTDLQFCGFCGVGTKTCNCQQDEKQ